MRLVLDLHKAKRGDRKAGAKYLDRTWDAKTSRWQYTYSRPAARGASGVQPGQLGLFDAPHQAPTAQRVSTAPAAPPRPRGLVHPSRKEGDRAWAKRDSWIDDLPMPERRATRLDHFERHARAQPLEEAIILLVSGNLTRHLTGTHNTVDFSNVDDGELSGSIVSHNHPTGRSFSPEDVVFAMRYKLLEIRAAGKRYRYSFKLPEDRLFSSSAVQKYSERIREIDREIREEFGRAILEGRMSRHDANYAHDHELWTRFAPEIGATYTREMWDDATHDTPYGVRQPGA